eukprot:4944865-Amphidinium_carterae.1
MRIGMIGLQMPEDNEVQPVVATTTLATESRSMRQSQAQQLRRRNLHTLRRAMYSSSARLSLETMQSSWPLRTDR